MTSTHRVQNAIVAPSRSQHGITARSHVSEDPAAAAAAPSGLTPPEEVVGGDRVSKHTAQVAPPPSSAVAIFFFCSTLDVLGMARGRLALRHAAWLFSVRQTAEGGGLRWKNFFGREARCGALLHTRRTRFCSSLTQCGCGRARCMEGVFHTSRMPRWAPSRPLYFYYWQGSWGARRQARARRDDRRGAVDVGRAGKKDEPKSQTRPRAPRQYLSLCSLFTRVWQSSPPSPPRRRRSLVTHPPL